MELYTILPHSSFYLCQNCLRDPESHADWSDIAIEVMILSRDGKLHSSGLPSLLSWKKTQILAMINHDTDVFDCACSTTVYHSWGETMTDQVNRRKGKRIEYFGDSRMVTTPDNPTMQAFRMDWPLWNRRRAGYGYLLGRRNSQIYQIYQIRRGFMPSANR